MPLRIRNTSILCAFVHCITTIASAQSASDWEVIKVNGHDFLSVDNIARFYGLPTGIRPADKRLRVGNDKYVLEFTRDSREVGINGARNWLSFPVVEQNGKFLVSRIDLAKTIEPQLRPHMIKNIGKVETVVIDPGHGGHDKGARNTFGYEKNFALDVARQLRPLLKAKGLKVVLTREGDYFVPLEVRARIANAAPNSIFVSIHFNATDRDRGANGFEIYSLTPRGAPSTYDDSLEERFVHMQAGSPFDAQSVGLSTCIYHSLLGHLSEFDRGIKRGRFAVLRYTKVPAVLIEGGFMTHRGENKLIADRKWRGKLAQAIGVGIESYKKVADTKQRPMLVADYKRKTSPEVSVPNGSDATEATPLPAPVAPPTVTGDEAMLPPGGASVEIRP